MARVSYVDPRDLPEEDRRLHEEFASYGPFGNLVAAMAHRPPIMRHALGMLQELAGEGVLAKRHLELALVTVSKLNACEYCVAHHAPKLTVEGVSPEGVARLPDVEGHPELDEVDLLVVEYARAVTENPNRVRNALFDRLHCHFDERQIVELTWRIALCGAFNRFNDVLQLEIEPEAAGKAA